MKSKISFFLVNKNPGELDFARRSELTTMRRRGKKYQISFFFFSPDVNLTGMNIYESRHQSVHGKDKPSYL
jgi:hypothetical protein